MSTRESSGAVITLMEETELIETQRRLRENEQRLLSIMNHSSTVVAVKDMSGRYEYVNPRFCEVFGVPAEKVLGLTDRQIFDEPLANAMRERDLDALRADQVVEKTEKLMLASGEREFFGIRFPLKGEDGVSYSVCLKLADLGTAWHDR
jgi:two-component system CheB/CheR fusion protein